MNRRILLDISLLLIALCLLICSVSVSADDKITFVRPVPDELSQNDNLDLFLKTSYPEGSFIRYNFTLDSPYPHRDKLKGMSGIIGGGTRISGNRTFVFHEKEYLGNFIPGDWNLTIWEESNPNKAYSKIIHIYPAGMEPEDEPAPPDFCSRGYKNLRQNFNINPEPDETDGIFAKGQPLYLTGTGLFGAKTGVWVYQETDEGKEAYSHFKSLSTDCNGEIMGSNEILPVFNSYNMPQGRYYVYAVSGDFEYTDKEIIPATYKELENAVLQNRNLQYQKFTFLAVDPEISISKNLPENAVIGTQYAIDGKTNLISGTNLEVIVSSSLVDYDSFQKIIVLQTKVLPGSGSNRWESVIDTSLLGPGEYIISVESPEGLGSDSTTLNTYYDIYSASASSQDVLSKKTYDVDQKTKSITGKTEFQNQNYYTTGNSDISQNFEFIDSASTMPGTAVSKAWGNMLSGISLILHGRL